jgi:hypothetical protein
MIDDLITALQEAKRRRRAVTPVGSRYAALCDLLEDDNAFAPEVGSPPDPPETAAIYSSWPRLSGLSFPTREAVA